MSKENALDFLKKLDNNSELFNKLKQTLSKTVCSIGSEEGFPFDEDDLFNAINEYNNSDLNVNNDILEYIAGGIHYNTT